MGAVGDVCTDADASTTCVSPAVCGYITSDTKSYLMRRMCSADATTAPTAAEITAKGYENWVFSLTKPSATSTYKTADAKNVVVGATTSLLAILYLL